MRKLGIWLCSALVLILFSTAVSSAYPSQTTVRLKDIAKVQGVRSNQLIGYGLVIGLDGWYR